MEKRTVGIDIECFDPLLKTSGYSWKYGQGYILNAALYYADRDEVKVIAGLRNESCPFTEEERKEAWDSVRLLLRSPDVRMVGANLQYDLGWILHELGMSASDVKCSLVDVLQAEAALDEWTVHSLESLSWKHLHEGKRKERIEEWVRLNVSQRGDFRAYLKDAPWELLSEYVAGDAKNPCKIWEKQLPLLSAQELCKRAKLEFDCILPTLQMTMTGLPFDTEGKKRSLERLDEAIALLQERFKKEYGFPNFRITAARDIASFLDFRNVPYNCKFTLTGAGGRKFASGSETDRAMRQAKRIVSQFRLVKGRPVALVPKELADRTALLLDEEGFMYNRCPNIDKNYFASQRNFYPEVALIADWKLAEGIKSKILGERYDRFMCRNFKGEECVKPQFKITDTVTFRYSSAMPNCQQIPSKGHLKVSRNGTEEEISFPSLVRTLFTASKGCVYGKIDYGQIEYRLICNIACGASGDEVRRQYAENPHLDFHQYTVDLTGLSRKYAKNMSFGLAFGMSVASMAANFGWTAEKAQEIYEAYTAHLPFVVPTLTLVGDVAKRRGYIKTVYGSRARLLDKNKGYTMLNRYTQGSGAECMKASIVQAYKEGVWQKLKVANTVHDELSMPYLEPTREHMLALYRMAHIMRTSVPGLRVPLEAEIELGDCWADTREIKDWISLRNEGSAEWDRTTEALKQSVSICEALIKEGLVQSA